MKKIVIIICLVFASSVQAVGIHNWQDASMEPLGTMSAYKQIFSIKMHDSGTLDEIWFPMLGYSNGKYFVYVYYCDNNLDPDFGQLIATSETHVSDSATWYWAKFEFTNPIQIQKNYCYSFDIEYADGYGDYEILQNQYWRAFDTKSQYENPDHEFVEYNGTFGYYFNLAGDVTTTGGFTIADDPTRNIYYGLTLFFIMFFGLLYYFKRK